MKIKGLIEEDFLQYKKPSMFIIFPKCDFKCCKEAGCEICQNLSVAKEPDIDVSPQTIVDKYVSNPITQAIVMGGLEPIDTYGDLVDLVRAFRLQTEDDIVIYTGYEWKEIDDELACLAQFKNIIVKVGRFIPNQKPHYDEVLGINLASDNQYAERIS